MKPTDSLDSIRALMRDYGALPRHEVAVLRAWLLARPVNQRRLILPARLNAALPEIQAKLSSLTEVARFSGEQGTRILWSLRDGQKIESVLLAKQGLCISTQVGCAVGCVFCSTGQLGLKRQLSDLEIAGQLAAARAIAPIRKVVLMGMGEPSHNLKAVMSAVALMLELGALARENVVVSTVGDARLFEALTEANLKPALAISLHSAFDEVRSRLLPHGARVSVREILAFGERYAKLSGIPIQYQWTLIDGVNDSPLEIERLAAMWPGQRAVLNMIPVNAVPNSSWKRPSAEKLAHLRSLCRQKGILLKYRDSAAQDVGGGCGQLAAQADKVTATAQPP